MISRSASAERVLLLEKRVAELREEMERVCSRYGLLTQELLIITEAIKLELKTEIEAVGRNQNNFPRMGGYLVD